MHGGKKNGQQPEGCERRVREYLPGAISKTIREIGQEMKINARKGFE
jgi:hypothetical protein